MRGVDKRFSELLRNTRRRLGWTQEQLAMASGVGRSTIIRWEQGATEPELQPLTAVMKALGLSVADAYDALGWLAMPNITTPDGPPPFELRDDGEREIWSARYLNADEKVELITYRRTRQDIAAGRAG